MVWCICWCLSRIFYFQLNVFYKKDQSRCLVVNTEMTIVTRYIVFEKGKLQTVKQKQKIFDENHETWQLGIMKVPISIHNIVYYSWYLQDRFFVFYFRLIYWPCCCLVTRQNSTEGMQTSMPLLRLQIFNLIAFYLGSRHWSRTGIPIHC